MGLVAVFGVALVAGAAIGPGEQPRFVDFQHAGTVHTAAFTALAGHDHQ